MIDDGMINLTMELIRKQNSEIEKGNYVKKLVRELLIPMMKFYSSTHYASRPSMRLNLENAKKKVLPSRNHP